MNGNYAKNSIWVREVNVPHSIRAPLAAELF